LERLIGTKLLMIVLRERYGYGDSEIRRVLAERSVFHTTELVDTPLAWEPGWGLCVVLTYWFRGDRTATRETFSYLPTEPNRLSRATVTTRQLEQHQPVPVNR
jgi:hypothetical protein